MNDWRPEQDAKTWSSKKKNQTKIVLFSLAKVFRSNNFGSKKKLRIRTPHEQMVLEFCKPFHSWMVLNNDRKESLFLSVFLSG